MTIIYKSVSEEIERKSIKNGFISYIENLLELYNEKDKTREKENLLTLYFNNTTQVQEEILELFVNKKFVFQIEKIKKERLEMCRKKWEPLALKHGIINNNIKKNKML